MLSRWRFLDVIPDAVDNVAGSISIAQDTAVIRNWTPIGGANLGADLTVMAGLG
jgi:hypothetical protein